MYKQANKVRNFALIIIHLLIFIAIFLKKPTILLAPNSDFGYILIYTDYYCKKYGYDSLRALARFRAESNFNSRAISKKGAVGIGQLMLQTAKSYEKVSKNDLFDIKTNIRISIKHMAHLKKVYKDEKIVADKYFWGNKKVLTDKYRKKEEQFYQQIKAHAHCLQQ
jgi:hypothetical protein